jgi:hypothetical protein
MNPMLKFQSDSAKIKLVKGWLTIDRLAAIHESFLPLLFHSGSAWDYSKRIHSNDKIVAEILARTGRRAIAKVVAFSLPSGWSCPGALICKSVADLATGRITDGKDATIRCYAASDESLRPNVRAARWHNFNILRKLDSESIFSELDRAFPKGVDVCRIHVGGDYFNQAYFNGWVLMATAYPETIFYSYTKSLNFWINCKLPIPPNLKLIASRGGRHDHLIDQHQLREAVIVFSPEEAESMGLEIDHTEEQAIEGTTNFALLIHGTQPKGSDASKAQSAMRKAGTKFSYSAVKVASRHS